MFLLVHELYLLERPLHISWVKVRSVCSKQRYSQHILCSCFEALLFQGTQCFILVNVLHSCWNFQIVSYQSMIVCILHDCNIRECNSCLLAHSFSPAVVFKNLSFDLHFSWLTTHRVTNTAFIHFHSFVHYQSEYGFMEAKVLHSGFVTISTLL